MEMKQIAELVNSAFKEQLGESAVLQEDLSNVVDIGKTIFAGGMDTIAMSGAVAGMLNQIGKMIFVNRKYDGVVPKLVRDAWEYGSMLCKVTTSTPEATENESWALQHGASYDPHVFYEATAELRFYNKRVTFEVDRSFTDRQLKQAFTSAAELQGFVAMIETATQNAITVRMEGLVYRTIDSMIADTIHADYGSGSISAASHNRAVNVLKLYNDGPNAGGTPLTFPACLTDGDFLRFFAMTVSLYSSRLRSMSILFNIGHQERFTPVDRQRFIALDQVQTAARFYLYNANGQLKDQYLALPDGESVPYWQGSGTSYDVSDTSSIDVVSASGHAVSTSGVLAVLFDEQAVAVGNLDRRVTTQYNAKGEFTNYFYKFDAGYMADPNENFIVFLAA